MKTEHLVPRVKEKVLRPFQEKLEETKEVISHHKWEFPDSLVVAFSGGKDSLVALHLTLEQIPDVSVVFNNTGVEYPETKRFVLSLADQWGFNLVITKPYKYSFWEVIELYGWPLESKRQAKDRKRANKPYCCYYLKERPMLLAIREHGWKGVITGIMAAESYNRMWWAGEKGHCFHHKKWNICKIHPLLWWTEDEVWDYIHMHNLPYNELYDRGLPRIGCMPCTAHRNWQAEILRANPKMYALVKLKRDHQYVMSLDGNKR